MSQIPSLSSMAFKALKAGAGAFAEAPVASTAGAVMGGEMLAPLFKSATVDEGKQELKQIGREQDFAQVQRFKAQKLQRLMAENTAQLAALDPHTYYEVLAGRRLPTGAVVFGGNPRTDLMQQLTAGMATGRYSPPPEDDLAGLMA